MKIQKSLKQIRYLVEALIVKVGIGFFNFLSPQRSSDLGSFLARKIGKRHSTSKLALRNIGLALPNLNDQEKKKILDDMWDNLGRVAGEFSQICKLSSRDLLKKYVTLSKQSVENIKLLKSYPRQGGIIFSGHIGNWEIGPKIFMNEGFKVNTVYRPLNNPYVEKMTAKMRQTSLIAKSAKGNRQIIEAIKKGEYVVILADQKISEGEKVKFFHDDAITTTSIARIALKYDVPLIPARSIRVNREFKFIAEIEMPLAFQKTFDLNKDVLDLTRLVNKRLESWILEYPAQWFWVHNRWKK